MKRFIHPFMIAFTLTALIVYCSGGISVLDFFQIEFGILCSWAIISTIEFEYE